MKVSGSEIVYFMLIFNLVLVMVPHIELVPGVTIQVGQIYQFITFNPYNNLIELMAQLQTVLQTTLLLFNSDTTCVLGSMFGYDVTGKGAICALVNLGNVIGTLLNIAFNAWALAIMVVLYSTVGSGFLYYQIFSIIDPNLGLFLGILLGTIQTIYVLCTLLVDVLMIISGIQKLM